MNSNTMGRLMEWGAKCWLSDVVRSYHWTTTDHFSRDDMRGIDIIGTSKSKPVDKILIQVKSSIDGAINFINREVIPKGIVVIIPDEDTGGFKIVYGKLPI